MGSLAKPPKTDTSHQKEILGSLCFIAVVLVAIFMFPSVSLKLQEEEFVTREALRRSTELEEDFRQTWDIEPLENSGGNRRGVNTQIAMWNTAENGGYFTYRAEGISRRFGYKRSKDYRVYYNYDGNDNIQIYHIERNPPLFH